MAERSRTPWPLSLALPLLLAWMFAQVILTSNNTLLRYPAWHSSKEELAHSPMGSARTVSTRNLLHQNRLNLEVWHGFQEIYREAVPNATECDLSFHFEEEGSLLWLLDRRIGVRLTGQECAWVEVDPGGEFLSVEPLPPLSSGQHQARLTWSGGELVLFADGREFARRPLMRPVEGVVSVRGNAAPVTVDDFQWFDQHGAVLVKEGFALSPWPVLARTLPGTAIAIFVLFAVTRSWRWCMRLQLVLLSLLCAYWLFDYAVWSARYPYRGYTPWGTNVSTHPFETRRVQLSRKLEFGLPESRKPRWRRPDDHPRKLLINSDRARRRTFGSGGIHTESIIPGLYSTRSMDFELGQRGESGDGRVIQRLPRGGQTLLTAPVQWCVAEQMELLDRDAPIPDAGDRKRRVILLGTSQSAGSGARTQEDSLGCLLAGALGEAVVLNTSHSGVNLATLLLEHEHYLKALRPTLVLANLGNNDAYDWKQFEKNLDRMLELNTLYGARTVLSLEPNCPSSSGVQNLKEYHQRMRDWAKRNGVLCLELHQQLLLLQGTGELWWDPVHLTSYGQRRAAEFWASKLPGG